MEGLNEKIEAAGKAAKFAEKFPWGTSIVILVFSFVLNYFIYSGALKEANKRAEKCEANNVLIINKLIDEQIENREKDNVIEQQKQVIELADSTIREDTRSYASRILNKNKRR